nr:MAG TPA: hypothetical protein [Caudoviricetes sp.]
MSRLLKNPLKKLMEHHSLQKITESKVLILI